MYRIWTRVSFSTQFTVLASLLVVGVVSALTILTIQREQATFQEELHTQVERLLDVLAYTSGDALYKLDVDELETLADLVDSDAQINGVRFYNPDGVLLVESTASDPAFTQEIDPLGAALMRTAKDRTYFEQKESQVVAGRAVTAGRETLGAVSVALSTASLDEKVAALRFQSFSVGVIVVLLAIGLNILVARQVSNPLRELHLAATKMSQGDLTARVTEGQSGPEVNNLARAFNQMAGQIQSLVDTLEQRVEERTAAVLKANEWLEQEVEERKQAQDALRQTHDQLDKQNRRLARAHEFVRSTLEQMTSSLYLGAPKAELLALLEQAQLEFNRIH